jgi:dTMP kinase
MGYIIAVEGTDGSGKKTQVDKLYERLNTLGYNVKRHSFPNYNSLSSAPVQMYLNGEFGSKDSSLDSFQASVLYAVDRLCTYQKDLKEFYENGGVILLDRYVQANMIHQACKIGEKEKVDEFLNWLDKLEFGDLKLPRADKVFFLDMPTEFSMKLAQSREEFKSNTKKDIHEQDPEHLKRAYKMANYVSDKYNWIKITCVENDSIKSIDEIHNEIYNCVKVDLDNFRR